MKTVGIIAEYNPFHKGHAYHIEETRRRTGADRCIVVMSGDFVQRGEPAIIDKYDRAEAALHHGADLVLMLPVTVSLSSAEGYARGGVGLLNKLGIVTDLSFGMEATSPADMAIIKEVTALLIKETDDYRKCLREQLSIGLSYPKARATALTQSIDCDPDRLNDLMQKPNTILGIEYRKALSYFNCSMNPVMIPREGADYHETGLADTFCSATAIRQGLLSGDPEYFAEALAGVPEDTRSSLTDHKQGFLTAEDFSDVLYYALRTNKNDDLSDELDRRIDHMLKEYNSCKAFADQLKTRNRTHSSITRHLMKRMLGITEESSQSLKSQKYAPYARVLGYRREAADLLTAIANAGQIPLICRPATDSQKLSQDARQLFETDLLAADLCREIRCRREGRILPSDTGRKLLVL